MKSKVLITGATGTVGVYTAIYLKERGYDVIATSRRKSDNNFFSEQGIEYYSVDVTNERDFKQLQAIEFDAVLHCAGVMPATMRSYRPEEYVDSVVRGTLNVLEFMRENNIPKIIFTQTRADTNYLMGTKNPIPSDVEKKFPLTGDHAVYSICKNAAVDLIEHYYHEHGIKRFVLRLPTIYAYHPNPTFCVNGKPKPIAYKLLINKAIKGEDIEVWGDPTREKEVTYINDLCQIIQKSLESSLDGGVYNVGRGVGVSLDEQIKGIVEVFSPEDSKSKIVYRPDMPDARQFIQDISKTQRELGYEPEYDYIKLLRAYKEEMELQRFRALWGGEGDYGE